MSASGIVNKSCPHPHHPCAVSLDKKSTTTTTTTTSVSYVRRPQPQSLKASSLSNNSSSFHGFKILLPQKQKHQTSLPLIQMKGGLIGKAHKWWEKGVQPNMKEITSAQDLVTSLLNAGDQLVIVDFFSPGCGGCKALHPKICQFAEMNPDVQFLQVNYEDHKSMAYSLNVHVLPFFRFYRGAHGRLCSFSCTNATVKKFKDALAKHTTLRCSLGPTKGLDESELFALAANKDLNFNYTPNPTTTPLQVPHLQPPQELPAPAPALAPANNLPSTSIKNPSSQDKQKTLVAATSS